MANKFEDDKWFQALEERQQKEVMFAITYAEQFTHGTDGHHKLLLIADMAEELHNFAEALRYYGDDE